MIVTTTPSVEGYQIADYKGIVVGEAILGANVIRDLFAGITDIIGGRSNAYEEELALPRTLEEALRGLREDKDIAELFGEKFIELYTSIKLVEFEEFNHVISSWEREHLLLNV